MAIDRYSFVSDIFHGCPEEDWRRMECGKCGRSWRCLRGGEWAKRCPACGSKSIKETAAGFDALGLRDEEV